MTSSKNNIQSLVASLNHEFGMQLGVDLSEPYEEDGVWIADIWLDKYRLVIQYSSRMGFGISTWNDSFTSKPDEIYTDYESAQVRAHELLASKGGTIRRANLPSLRKPCTQLQIAIGMGIKQPSYARMEKSSLLALKLSTLVSILCASDHQLLLLVQDRNGQVSQLFDEDEFLDDSGKENRRLMTGIARVPIGLTASNTHRSSSWEQFRNKLFDMT